MVDLKFNISWILGKITYVLTKLSKTGGTALPGLIALKADKKIIEKISKQLRFSIIICGTNGKTTTSRILSSILNAASVTHVHNRTGSNLLRGIASTLINKRITIFKNPKKIIGLWEVDEAVLPQAIKKLKPKIVLINNLFRDQLDRYGEIDTLAKKWKTALKKLPKSVVVILNADDPTVASLGENLDSKVLYFGLKNKSLGSHTLSHASDATVCPYCLLPLDYEICFISHLGIYKCLKCGNIQPQAGIICSKAKILNNYSTQLFIRDPSCLHVLKINLHGLYNIYNSLAAFSVAFVLKINLKKNSAGFENFKPAFGRFEKINVNGKKLKILLVKNPAGFNETLKTILKLTGSNSFSCLIALNDLIADGRDVSWIWDVDFEKSILSKSENIIVSGIRAEDMALRIKYANLPINNQQLTINNQLKKAVNNLLKAQSDNLFILPTYTAMLEIRKILNKMGLVHSTWRD